ncbi:MAG: ABC transporter permease [Acidobacteriaceae bacterium]|nr:ABC transporter permease [Acidobacteriaceae bacterium]
MQYLRYAFRKLRNSPIFTVTAILTLTLGIGATTAIFSIVYGVLLKPLEYPQPEQLVNIQESIQAPGTGFPVVPVNANHLLYWRKHNHSFSGLSALLPESMPLGGGRPEEIGVGRETANLFSVLGVQPRLGRAFLPQEEEPGHADVVILTDGLWKRRYGADTGIVGKSVVLNGRPYEVTGVLPADFTLTRPEMMGGSGAAGKPIEAFVPFRWNSDVLQEIEGDHNYFAIGRLKQGVTVERARAELNVLQSAISQQTPDKVRYGAIVSNFQEYLTGSSRRSLLLLLVAVGAVLLIACINIANLLLIRATGSSHEAAVRAALGASRLQLISNALAEPILLCAIGCTAGVALAIAIVPLLVHNVPAELPRLNGVHVGGSALAFAVGVSTVAALLCGLFPSWRNAKADPQPALRSESRTSTDSRGNRRLQSALVTGEVAASVALVIMAALFISSIVRLLHVNRGFQSERVLSAKIVLPDKQYGDKSRRDAFYERVLARLRLLPGVQAAGAVSVLPLDGDNWGDLISKIGDPTPLWQRPDAHFRWITPGYLETLHVPLIAGHLLSASDRNRNVALISHQVAEKIWPHQSAIGQRFTRGDPDEKPFEVIGVVGDIHSLDLSKPSPRMVYVPYWYRSREVGSFVIRTQQDPEPMASSLRNAIWTVDPQVPLPSVRTMEAVVAGSVAIRRFEMRLLLAFAVSALLLAGIGIYGVVASTATRRKHEIGIRMALGADVRDVYRLILRQGITPVLVGTAIGIVFAWMSGRFLAGLLFEVSASDPLITAIACLILLAVGISASLLPAWQAGRIEPLNALRHE